MRTMKLIVVFGLPLLCPLIALYGHEGVDSYIPMGLVFWGFIADLASSDLQGVPIGGILLPIAFVIIPYLLYAGVVWGLLVAITKIKQKFLTNRIS